MPLQQHRHKILFHIQTPRESSFESVNKKTKQKPWCGSPLVHRKSQHKLQLTTNYLRPHVDWLSSILLGIETTFKGMSGKFH